MAEEQNPNVEEIKERLKIEVEEIEMTEEETATKAETESVNVTEELKDLGRQVAETLRSAWESAERQKVESEIREGVKSFVDEIDKAVREAKSSTTAQKFHNDAAEMRQKIESSDIADKARTGVVQGLRWLSDELGKLAEQFNPPEKTEEENS